MTAEPSPHDPRPEGPGILEPPNRRLDRRRGDLVVIPQAGVGLIEQRAQPVEVSITQRLDRRIDALVVGDDVTQAPVQGLRQPLGRFERGITQALDAEELTRPRTLRAALVVARRGVGVVSPESRVTI